MHVPTPKDVNLKVNIKKLSKIKILILIEKLNDENLRSQKFEIKKESFF